MASHKIKIAARLRPALPGENTDDNIAVHHALDDSNDSTKGSYISVLNPRDVSQVFKFPFTSCYDQNSTQDEIFLNDVEPLLDVVFSGVTVTIFAYGVTSSGKTHTMQGTRAEPGIIPRTVQALFDQQKQYPQYDITFSMSYMELYKDEPYDLLVTRENAPKLPVREDGNGQVFVANLSTVTVTSAAEFDTIYNQATKNRSIGATNLNRASSRSHAILTFEVLMMDPSKQTTLAGKINLVDLAGSENNKLTGNDPSRMAESKAINQSLSVLGQVVHALNQSATRIPYRNSKLTRLLQDALGGSSVGLLICNLAPGKNFRQDTLNTLNFATRTKNIENKPVINERDNRPVPKPHFAAPPAPKLAPTILQPINTTAGPSAPSVVPSSRRARQSLAPTATTRVPRISSIGVGGSGSGYQRFAIPAVGVGRRSLESVEEKVVGGFGMTEKDIEEKIMKVVEVEVAKRLAVERQKDEAERRVRELEKEKELDLARENARIQAEQERLRMSSPSKKSSSSSLPAGVLTPLLKKHKDLDDELRARLHDLERKLDQGHKETSLAGVMSPVSKKKTGRAYVSLARSYSEKGKLEDALELYRQAEAYVPDNIKLKERIIELEWAVKNNKEFIPSPKPSRKERKKKGRKDRKGKDEMEDEMETVVEEEENGTKKLANGSGSRSIDFGMELTNRTTTESPKLSKRLFMETRDGNGNGEDIGDDGVQSGGGGGIDSQTPHKKKMKLEGSFGGESTDQEGWLLLPPAPTKDRKMFVS